MQILRHTLWAAVLSAVALWGCTRSDPHGGREPQHVVVFTSLDRIYSEPILHRFEKETGIQVRAVYDAEAAKTTGLVNRLIARRERPECDVLWNNEVVQTESLAQMGLLAPYRSSQVHRFPPAWRDPQGRWAGFAARLRIIVYNPRLISRKDVPVNLEKWADPHWRGQAAIALPYFGTTFTHMSILHQRWGDEKLQGWFQDLQSNDTAFAAGNGPVRDLVTAGERTFGLTDSDDAQGAILDGKSVGVILPDPDHGLLLIPNTVALIARCPHPAEGKTLIDFLLSAEVEIELAGGRSAQIPLAEDLRHIQTPWSAMIEDAPSADWDIATAAAAREDVIATVRRAEARR